MLILTQTLFSYILSTKLISYVKDKCEADGKNVCENEGFCSIDQEGIVYCICPKEYEGQHCEIGKKSYLLVFQ